MEVIDLSSDDEKSPPKKQNTGSSPVAARKKEKKNIDNNVDDGELEVVYNMVKRQKRNIDRRDGDSPMIKKIKLSTEKKYSNIVTNTLLNKKSEISLHRIKPKTLSSRCTPGVFKSDPITGSGNESDSSLQTNESANNLLKNEKDYECVLESPKSRDNTNSFKINEGASSSTQIMKPQLTIMNKIRVSESTESNLRPSLEIVESFLDACRSQDSSRDMEKIISKLKKRYKNLQPSYAKSGSFIELIRNKRNLVLNNRAKLYLYISEVMDEMKARQLQKGSLAKDKYKNKSDIGKEGTNTQPGASDIPEEYSVLETDASVIEDSKYNERLQTLEKAMQRCERYIKKCEEAEVNFDDENDSHYIISEKYKSRMVQLYNKYCEITGERPDAARPYLRPKHLSVTPIPSLNDAITSFINMKITRTNQRLTQIKKNDGQLRLTDALIFPDYVDILNCIQKCNDEENLQLNKLKQQSIAKDAFDKLGQHLQRCRQLDYYDTFSLYLEKEESGDPASSDRILAEKLNANQEIGKKKLDAVFQEFVEKEIAARATQNGTCLENEEDSKTGDESSEDTDDHSVSSEFEKIGIRVDSDSEQDKNNDANIEPKDDTNQKAREDIQIDEPLADLNLEGDDVIEIDKPQDDSKQKVNEDVEVDEPMDTNKENSENDKQNDVLKSISVDQTDGNINEIEPSEPNVDIVANDVQVTKEKETDLMPDQDVLNNSTSIDIHRISIDQETKKTKDPGDTGNIALLSKPTKESASTVATCKVNFMQAAETLETNSGDECSIIIPENTTKVIDAPTLATTVESIIKDEEKKKPLLRVRQFAKPPGSWKDFQSPTKNLTETTPEAVETSHVDKEVEKLNETRQLIISKQNIVLGKTVQFKNDVLLNLKNKKSTIIIPPNLNRSINHINVKSITNNVTVNFNNQNPQGLKSPKNIVNIDQSGKIITHCNNVVGVIKINSEKSKSSPIKTVETGRTNNLIIRKPSGQVRLNEQQTAEIKSQPVYQIVKSKSSPDQEKTIVRDIPVISGNGKKTVVRLVKCSPGFKLQNNNISTEVAGTDTQNQTENTPNIIPNKKSSTVVGSDLKTHISNRIKKILPLKISRQLFTNVEKVYETSDGVPTYTIE